MTHSTDQAPKASSSGEASPQARRDESRLKASEKEIISLFDRWNRALQSGDPHRVVATYAERSILLPTMSGDLRLTREEKLEYFRGIMKYQPSGEVGLRQVTIGSGMAVDTGHYTFRFAATGRVVRARYSFTYQWNGEEWLIVSHHSSVLPDNNG